MLNRRYFTSALVACPFIVKAQGGYPLGMNTIKIVVPYPPGGSTDIIGRLYAERLSKLWNITTIVENIAGAGAMSGMDRVAKGATDGSSILIVPPPLATNEFLFKTMPFNPLNDIKLLGQLVRSANLLAFRKNLEMNSVKELIDHAKANPDKLTYASAGIGTTIHLSGALFCKYAGVSMRHIPYRGSAPAVNDLVGGQVDMSFDNIPSIMPQVEAGNVKGIAVTSLNRQPTANKFPTISESLAGFDAVAWFGVGVSAGTPKEICDKIEQVSQQICKEPEVIARFASLHAETIGSSAAAFTQLVANERKKWGDLIKELQIQAN